MTAGSRRMAMNNPSDAELGFRPSSAPALNASVSQWVSAADHGALPSDGGPGRRCRHLSGCGASRSAPASGRPASERQGRPPAGTWAPCLRTLLPNLDAVPGTPVGMAASDEWRHSADRDHLFPGDTTSLPKAARPRSASRGGRSRQAAGPVPSRS